MKIAIIKEQYTMPFEGEQYEVDLSRGFGGYEYGDLIIYGEPFLGLPLTLEIGVRKTGEMVFRKWKFCADKGNNYFHTDAKSEAACAGGVAAFIPTAEQVDTVSGLFSGRIKFEGLKLAIGQTIADVCPIDVKAEEKRTGKRVFLNG